MTRLERLAVLAVLVVLVALLVLWHPLSALLGAAAGVAGGLVVGGRLARVRRRVDARLGDDVAVPGSGLRVQVVVRRVLLQGVVLAALFVLAVLTPFAGGRAVALVGAAATALPAVLTVRRPAG